MKVLITDRLGGGSSIWSLMNAVGGSLVDAGHGVLFCRLHEGGGGEETPSPPQGIEVETIEVAPKRRAWDVIAQQRIFGGAFRRLLRDFRPDIVHTNFAVPGIVARYMARREGVPVVVSTQHELYGSMSAHLRWGVRSTERCADAVVYVSHAVARSFDRPAVTFSGQTDGASPRHVVIHNGIDFARLEAIRAAAGPVERDRIVCAGRLVPVKGQRTLVEAMPAVRRVRPGARLVLIGGGPDEARLRERATALGVADAVRFAGWLPQEAALAEMATAGAVAVPSDGSQEGFGLVLLEALGLGSPVVASRIPVFEEIAGPAADGVGFFRPGGPRDLADRLIAALDRPACGKQARNVLEALEARFSLERMVASYRALYDDLLLTPQTRSAARY